MQKKKKIPSTTDSKLEPELEQKMMEVEQDWYQNELVETGIKMVLVPHEKYYKYNLKKFPIHLLYMYLQGMHMKLWIGFRKSCKKKDGCIEN